MRHFRCRNPRKSLCALIVVFCYHTALAKGRIARISHKVSGLWTDQREVAMALKGVLRPGYIQIRVTDLDAALTHYVDRVGLHKVSREHDGRVYLRAWDEFDRHSIVLREADVSKNSALRSRKSRQEN